jgi:carboxyl-terminal processing protease
MQANENNAPQIAVKNSGQFKWWLIPTLLGAVSFGALLGGSLAFSSQGKIANLADTTREDTLRQLDIYADVLARVTTDYVVPPKQDKLIEASINGMLQSLDPHSAFMTNKDFKDMQQTTKGEYGGLGLEVTSDAGAVKVIAPMAGGPGERAGIQAGDRIIAIDGVNIVGSPLNDAVEKMRGKPNTTVEITIVHEGQEPKPLKIVREVIKLHPVTSKIEGNVGYIKLSTFVNENAANEVSAALDDIQKKLGGNVKGIILDLRNNGGGLLDQAVAVSDLFMDRGEVVSTRGRRPEDIDRFYGNAGQKMAGVPLIILTNEGSASASEIVAGALQDRKRAIIFGTTTFGKGSVQTVIPLNYGKDGALRLTTQRYYTPSGRSIQGAGIKPDIEVSNVRLTQADIDRRKLEFRFEEDLPNALNNESGAKRAEPHMPADMPPENWDKKDDYVLKRALAYINAGMPKNWAANSTPIAPAAPVAPAKDAKPIDTSKKQ